MTLTREQALTGFSKFISDYWASTTTAAGASNGTTLVDTLLGRNGDDSVSDRYFRVTSGTATQQIRRALGSQSFQSATGEVTVQPSFSAQIATSVTYEMHKYDPADKIAALNEARLAVLPWVFKEVRDDTLTGDGRTDEFPLPSTVEWGPELAMIEERIPAGAEWNLLTEHNAEVTTSGNWVAAGGVVATDYSQQHHDKIVPRFQPSAVKLVYTDAGTDGTYTIPVANMRSGVTAVNVAGRHVELGLMVYCEVAGPVAEIITDAGTLVTSSAHQGRGWELLTCEGDVGQANATTFSARIRFPNSGLAAHRLAYFEEAFLVLGNLPSRFIEEHAIEVEYDDTSRRVYMRGRPSKGYHIRLVGKAPISAIEYANMTTATVEVDEKSAQIWYADAAEKLFGHEILSQPAQRDVLGRIATVKEKRTMFQKTWKYRMKQGRLASPFQW